MQKQSQSDLRHQILSDMRIVEQVLHHRKLDNMDAAQLQQIAEQVAALRAMVEIYWQENIQFERGLFR